MKEVKGMKEYEILLKLLIPVVVIAILSKRSLKQRLRARKLMSKKKEDFQSLIRLRIPTAGL